MLHKINRMAIGVPLLLLAIATVVCISFFQVPDVVIDALAVDLILTLPLLYLWVIWKSKVPKITVVPVTISGLVLGRFLLPADQQTILLNFQTWVLPVVELTVFGVIIYKIRQLRKAFRQTEDLDFFSQLKMATKQVLPAKVAPIFVTEISMFYYAFVAWRKPKPLQANQFSSHKESGVLALYGAFLFVILIEAVALHFLLVQWSLIAAWILTILSVYTAIQVLGFVKSIPRRAITVHNDHIHITHGMLSEMRIPKSQIEKVERFTRDLEPDEKIPHISPLGKMTAHNVKFTFREPVTIELLYGMKKEVGEVLVFVDDVDGLIEYSTFT